MRIVLVTPYLPAARNGNAHTALRWRHFLRQAGHRVDMGLSWQGEAADLLVALHARRSHAAIARFSEAYPARPIVLILTGTDLYRDILVSPEAQVSLKLAHRLVVLQDQGLLELPVPYRAKTWVIYQSAPAIASAQRPVRYFNVGAVAHLRAEKDPFRAVLATRLLPVASRIQAWHVGGELEPGMVRIAEDLAASAPRWHWFGARPHGETRRRIARSHLLVVSSRMEGGANVICEALTAGTPVLASRIPGNVGMLGEDYAGYFPLEDEQTLAALMWRAESDAAFYAQLVDQCAARAPLFAPAREAAAVQSLVAELA